MTIILLKQAIIKKGIYEINAQRNKKIKQLFELANGIDSTICTRKRRQKIIFNE